jgi:hypothetical protein
MSRRIETGPAIVPGSTLPDDALKLGTRRKVGGEDYLGRLVKYIPAEIVGLYIATSAMVPQAQDGNLNCRALWIVFVLNLILVPIYLWFATTRGGHTPLWPQVFLSTLAFPVWVFAIGGPFKCLGWYQGWIASIILAFVTVVFAMYRPKPGS